MKRFLVVLALLSILLMLVPACGGGGKKITPTPTATATATATITPTTSGNPVKIGVVFTWSGPMAMSGAMMDQIIGLVEKQVRDMGGILGGRDIQFVRGDDRGVSAESTAQAKKLILEDKVSIITLGGLTVASMTAVSDVCENYKIPFVSEAAIYNIADKKYTVIPLWHDSMIIPPAEFITNVLKPKTIAWLSSNYEDTHAAYSGLEGIAGFKPRMIAAGIDIVSEQWFPVDTSDFSPYLTKIKYANPDLLVVFLNNYSQAVSINRQIMDLGGWGDTKLFGATEISAAAGAVKIASAVGSYVTVLWMPGSDEPGMKTFEDACTQKYGRVSDPNLTFMYNVEWIAIHAIELAGSDDPAKVAEALRSGNVQFDSAWGPMRIDSEGKGKVSVTVAQVHEGGKMEKVWKWDPEE